MPRLQPVKIAKLLTVLAIVPGLYLSGHEVLTPPGKTGAPGENTCAECHISQPNTRNGRLTVEFTTLGIYIPGVRQQITVRVTPGLTSYSGAGFQATARLSSNTLTTAGRLESGPSQTAIQTLNGLEYANHFGVSADRSYTFFWTAPSSNVGNVTFYFAAVAGPRDSVANAIDEVYTASYTLRPALSTAPSGYRWDFPTGIPGTSSSGTGISNNGHLVGTYTTGTQTRGFLKLNDGSPVVLVDPPGAVHTFPSGVNNAGTVVGSYELANGTRRGFVRSAAGVYSDFIQGSLNTSINAIIDSGDMAATRSSGVISQGVRLSPTLQVTQDLSRAPLGLNANGVFSASGASPLITDPRPFGYLQSADAATASFPSPCPPGSFQTLTNLGLNDNGDLAGSCSAESAPEEGNVFSRKAFLRLANSRILELGSRSSPVLSSITGPYAAGGINNANQIAATGIAAVGGPSRAMILNTCQATISQGPVSVPGGGQTYNIPVVAAADCHWLAASDSDWVTASQSGGTGNGTFSFNVAPNTTALSRTATVTIGGNLVPVTQEAAACNFTFTSPSVFLGAEGTTTFVSFTAANACTWVATSTAQWITFPSGNTGAGSGAVAFSVTANPGTAQRFGTIMIGGAQFAVTQSGSFSCIYQVTASGSPFGVAGGTGSLNVVTGDGCPWNATTGETWLTIDQNTRFGSGVLNFTVAANTTSFNRFATIFAGGTGVSIQQLTTPTSTVGLRFVPVTPCRVADTRADGGKTGSFGPPRIAGNSTREFPIPTSTCGIPFSARAYSVNITAVPPGPLSFITVWPSGQTQPLVSTLNSFNGRVVANAAVVPAGSNGSINVFASNDTELIIDINGYFVPADSLQGLAFYPLAPCRVADTRVGGGKSGEFGPPSIPADSSRTMTIPNSGCGVPASAQAYSVNVTAVPPGPLAFVTIWPAGQTRPVVSTLNSFDGQVVANAAIVPAGINGAINVYASNNTDIVVDINGYFAPPGQAGGLNFYTLTPCRVADTRNADGSFGGPRVGGGTTRAFAVPNSSCSVPATSQAYSLNLTAVPPGPLAFVTLWPLGQSQPTVSTLNSFNGQVVANAALVPSGTGGVNVFAANDSHIVIDINGYFAP
jgi:hypothetical protein